MDEKKANELTDETLDKVTGGAKFVPFNLTKWCSHCNANVQYRIVFENGTTREECLRCGNPIGTDR